MRPVLVYIIPILLSAALIWIYVIYSVACSSVNLKTVNQESQGAIIPMQANRLEIISVIIDPDKRKVNKIITDSNLLTMIVNAKRIDLLDKNERPAVRPDRTYGCKVFFSDGSTKAFILEVVASRTFFKLDGELFVIDSNLNP